MTRDAEALASGPTAVTILRHQWSLGYRVSYFRTCLSLCGMVPPPVDLAGMLGVDVRG